jgi:hypothetical protein
MIGSSVLAYAAASLIISLAYVAGATQWCSASALYNRLSSIPRSA